MRIKKIVIARLMVKYCKVICNIFFFFKNKRLDGNVLKINLNFGLTQL